MICVLGSWKCLYNNLIFRTNIITCGWFRRIFLVYRQHAGSTLPKTIRVSLFLPSRVFRCLHLCGKSDRNEIFHSIENECVCRLETNVLDFLSYVLLSPHFRFMTMTICKALRSFKRPIDEQREDKWNCSLSFTDNETHSMPAINGNRKPLWEILNEGENFNKLSIFFFPIEHKFNRRSR